MWQIKNRAGSELGIGVEPDYSRLQPCNFCKEMKPLSDYYFSQYTKNGFVKTCKVCVRARAEAKGNTIIVKEKVCSSCGEMKPASDYNKTKIAADGMHSRCKVCARWEDINRLYGVSRQEYEKMFFEQDGKCAICKKPSLRKLHVDHCHATGKARALLCFTCNSGIGMFGDDENLILRAAEYIRSFKFSAPCGEETNPGNPALQ